MEWLPCQYEQRENVAEQSEYANGRKNDSVHLQRKKCVNLIGYGLSSDVFQPIKLLFSDCSQQQSRSINH